MTERIGASGIQFVLQIILARILDPEHYGVLSLMIIFTNLANVFIQTGFSSALIQNKDVTDRDFSSVFWVTLGIASVIYGVLFLTFPVIADYYDMPQIVAPFRVLALVLFPGALNSVQLAKVSRKLDFKKVFFSNIGAITVSGIVGIAVACMGGGIWALVIQNLLNTSIACVIMLFTVKWLPEFVIVISRVKSLFSYGWKLLVSSLLDTLYQDLRSLVIGKKYSKDTLGYYNRGKQFPQFVINIVNMAVQSVMLPAMSAKQDDKNQVKRLCRASIMTSAYVLFPMMAGLAAVAPAVVTILLTDKWLPCVPYMQIYCISLAAYPVHSCNLQAINAMGRSDLFLILELIKKAIGITALVIAVFCFDSPIAIALTGIVTTIMSFFVNAFPNKNLIGYSYLEQARDLAPQIVMSAVMFAAIYGINYLAASPIVKLLLQVPLGVLVYFVLSKVFHVESYEFILSVLKGNLNRDKKQIKE